MIKRYNKSYFNLIELMVVIAIIGILLSMLMPALSSARDASMSAVCKSNQGNIYKAYIMHSEGGLMELLDAPWKVNSTKWFHRPGQLLHRNNVHKRLRIGILELDSASEMNCPTFEGLYDTSASSYGSNSEGNDTHYARQSVRLYFAQINSTSNFILMGCRDMNGSSYVLEKNANQLATYHPKGTGNVFCADGNIRSTKWSTLMNQGSNPSLLNE